MKNRILLVIFLFIIMPATISAEIVHDKGQMIEVTTKHVSDLKKLNKASLFIEELPNGKARIPDFSKSYADTLNTVTKTKPAGKFLFWPGRKGLLIVASIYDLDDKGEYNLGLKITIYKLIKPNEFQIIARSDGPLPSYFKSNENELGVIFKNLIGIDPASYKIGRNEYAFGIRIGYDSSYSHGHEEYHNLILFVLRDNKIIPVLNQNVYEVITDQYEDVHNEWVVIISPKIHEEHFDLVLKKKGSKTVKHFIWKQGRYFEDKTQK